MRSDIRESSLFFSGYSFSTGYVWRVLSFLLFLSGVLAQSATVGISGKVMDGAGQPIPDSVIEVKHVLSASAYSVRTGVNGNFVLDSLVAGEYQLKILQSGFAPHVQTVQVPVNDLEIRLVPEALRQSVTVSAGSGYIQTTASAGTRIPASLMDVPQSIQVVARNIIDQRLDFQLADTARTVSGVSRTNTGSGYLGNEFSIRGFTLNTANSYLRDGMKFGIYSFSDLASVEEVEVLKGPASVLYGASEPGGVINLVTKKPLEDQVISLQFTGGNGDFRRPEFDASGPLLKNRTLLYRISGSYQQDFRFRDYGKGSHYFLSPSITWRPVDKMILNVSGEYLNGQATSDFGIPVLGSRPAPVPVSRFYGESFNIAQAWPRFLTHSFHYNFSSRWSIDNRYSYWSAGSNYFEAYPTGVSADGRTVSRLLDSYRFPEKSKYSQTEIVGAFDTGPIQHTILLGFEAGWRSGGTFGQIANAPSVDSLNPVTGLVTREDAFRILANPLSPGYADNHSVNSVRNQSGYIQDLMTLGKRWKALIGGRFENYPQESRNYLTHTYFQNADLASSPRAGLVFQPSQTTSIYFSYVRSFMPASPSSRNILGIPFKPQHGVQYESGVKYTSRNRRTSATLAAFWITKDNVITPDPLNPLFNVQSGEQRSKGFDFDFMKQIADGWNVWFAYGFAQAQVTSDNSVPVGNMLLNAPRHTGNIWSVYEIPRGRLRGLGFGGGIYSSSFKYGTLQNNYLVPGYARVDTSTFYTIRGDKVDWKLSLNLKNALDRSYYEAGRGAFVRPGLPFAVYSSVKMTWH